MRKRTAWAAILVLIAFMLYGCGAASKSADSFSGNSVAEAPSAAPSGAPSPVTAPMEAGSIADAAVGDGGVAVTDRKIIQNAEIEIRVKDGDVSLSEISQAVRASGGYVQESRMEGTRESGRHITISVRVPAGSYGSILDLLSGLGEVTDRREWINDVTEEYLDLDARIKTKEIHLAQLQKLYERGGTIKELMELEQEIARVTADLESLKGRFNFLSNQVEYSTIRISLFEPGVPTPAKDPQTLGERMRDGFLYSWHSVLELGADLLVGIVALIPRLLFLAVLGGIVGAIVWLVRKRRRRGGGGGGGADRAA